MTIDIIGHSDLRKICFFLKKSENKENTFRCFIHKSEIAAQTVELTEENIGVYDNESISCYHGSFPRIRRRQHVCDRVACICGNALQGFHRGI